MMDINKYKEIHIGKCIQERLKECDIDMKRVTHFMKQNETQICNTFSQPSLESEVLLRWSKLLEYDFFRLFSQHLILYAPVASVNKDDSIKSRHTPPQFRKNLYSQDLILFVLELIEKKIKTKNEIIAEYKIPKTTLYKWIAKYASPEE